MSVRWKEPRPSLGAGAKMICIGPGPGPKNVLAERPDGSRIVVPYPVWKYRKP